MATISVALCTSSSSEFDDEFAGTVMDSYLAKKMQVIMVHGGPGSATNPPRARYFDPKHC